jgi:hypothetical protein
MMIPTVEHNWVLAKTSNLEPIKQLTGAHDKRILPFLNQPGTATTWLHLLDPDCELIEEHKTSLICYRNERAIWSGEIFDCEEISEANTDQLQITAMGWFQLLNERIVHTGLEWEQMVVTRSGRNIIRYPTESKEVEEIEKQYEETVASGFYTPLATESALSLFYNNKPFSEIARDLIERANIDVPTGVTMGLVPPMNSINLTVPQFHPVGELLTQLTSIESGFDFNIDPLTRKFNIYWNTIRGGITGLGQDRGAGVRFTYPGNCTKVSRKRLGTKTQNRTEAVGQLGVGKAESIQSINENGLFEKSENLSDVVNENILTAFAEIQTLTLEKPFTIITFQPKSVGPGDVPISEVPRPFEDYELGDIVYSVIEKGNRFRVGMENPQPIRIYGFSLEITDEGQEKISNLQTTYTS